MNLKLNGELKRFKEASMRLEQFKAEHPELAQLEGEIQEAVNLIKEKAKLAAEESQKGFKEVKNGVVIQAVKRQADSYNISELGPRALLDLNAKNLLQIASTNYQKALKVNSVDQEIDTQVRKPGFNYAVSVKLA